MSNDDKEMKKKIDDALREQEKNEAMLREFERPGIGLGFSLTPAKPKVKRLEDKLSEPLTKDENLQNQERTPNPSADPVKNTAAQVSPIQAVQQPQEPYPPVITPLRSVKEAAQKAAATSLSAPTDAAKFEDLCTKISASAGKSNNCVFERKSPTELTVKEKPNGDVVKVEQTGEKAVCTFEGRNGMEASAKVILDGFINSRQTNLHIGGDNPDMVLTLARLVVDRLEGPPKLTVTIASDAEEILKKEDPALLKKLEAKPPAVNVISRSAPGR